MENMTLQTKKQQSGFTLIEIAIVLVIIGLLLGGVLQGQQLIENSRVRSATNDFNGIAAAAFSYQDRYGRLPGDDPNADSGRGAAWPATAAGSQGNGDGVITGTLANTFDGGGEVGLFFRNLMSSGFIPGDGLNDTGINALPQNPFGGLTGITNQLVFGGLAGTKVCMSNVSGTAANALDTQLDDGSAQTGRFRGEDDTATNTAPTNTAHTSANYDESSIFTICYRI